MAKDNKKAAAPAQKPKKKKQKGRLKEYFKGVRLEMKKVVWPTKKELSQYAALVIVACAFFAVAFWAIDTGFLAILKQLLGISM
jgi:preprotein translocase subunit SecE